MFRRRLGGRTHSCQMQGRILIETVKRDKQLTIPAFGSAQALSDASATISNCIGQATDPVPESYRG